MALSWLNHSNDEKDLKGLVKSWKIWFWKNQKHSNRSWNSQSLIISIINKKKQSFYNGLKQLKKVIGTTSILGIFCVVTHNFEILKSKKNLSYNSFFIKNKI